VFVIVSSDITSNNYDHVDVVGDVANALDQCITVMDYGATGLEEIGLLRTAKGADEFVAPTNLKPKQTDDRLHSTADVTLEGRFKL
jgi:predicted Zn-dependent protease